MTSGVYLDSFGRMIPNILAGRKRIGELDLLRYSSSLPAELAALIFTEETPEIIQGKPALRIFFHKIEKKL